jgi:integrase
MRMPEGTIFKRPDRNGYHWRFTWKGRRRTMSAGRTKADALAFRRRFWEKLREQERTGQVPIDAITFAKFVPIYMEHAEKTKAATTVRRERDKLEGVLMGIFGKRNVHEIRQPDIVRWLERRKVTVATRNRDLSQLSAFFKYAISLGHARENPVKGIGRPKEEQKPVPWVEERIQNTFLAMLPADLKPLCITAVDTGMRQGELLALEWRDVDLGEGTILVRKSKTKQPRIIPMTRRVRNVMVDLSQARPEERSSSDRVFSMVRHKWGGYLSASNRSGGSRLGSGQAR